MATAPKFRVDVDIHNLLMDLLREPVRPVAVKGLTLPEPVFPQYPEKATRSRIRDSREKRDWSPSHVYRTCADGCSHSTFREWEFHPITAYLFVEYKCNLDCWRGWAYNNKVKGMTEDVARRSIDWLYDHGCRGVGVWLRHPTTRS